MVELEDREPDGYTGYLRRMHKPLFDRTIGDLLRAQEGLYRKRSKPSATAVADGKTGTAERIQKLEDEAAIRDLPAAFADAATRHNLAEVLAIWKKDEVFTIGAPLKNVAKGVEAIVVSSPSCEATRSSLCNSYIPDQSS